VWLHFLVLDDRLNSDFTRVLLITDLYTSTDIDLYWLLLVFINYWFLREYCLINIDWFATVWASHHSDSSCLFDWFVLNCFFRVFPCIIIFYKTFSLLLQNLLYFYIWFNLATSLVYIALSPFACTVYTFVYIFNCKHIERDTKIYVSLFY